VGCLLQFVQKLSRRQNANSLKHSERQQVPIAGHDYVRMSGNGAGDNRIVIRIISNRARDFGRIHPNDCGFVLLQENGRRQTQIRKAADKFWSVQDVGQFFNQRGACENGDLTTRRRVEDVAWCATPQQAGYHRVCIKNDSHVWPVSRHA